MRTLTQIFFLMVFTAVISFERALAAENYLFGYTHLLPSPFTIPQGQIAVGTTTGVGVTPFMDVETNLISDFFQIYNARARFSLFDNRQFAIGAYLGYQMVNLNNLAPANPSVTLSAWMPGATVAVEVLPAVAMFFGVQLFYPNMNIINSEIDSSGYLAGAQVETDVSWAYNPHQGHAANALSGGITYNTTFSFYGLGISHHWPGFQLGIHYYPNAQNLKVLPIFSAGGALNI